MRPPYVHRINSDFMDVRNHGYTRVGVAVPRVHLADPLHNLDEHCDHVDSLYQSSVLYALFPELGLSGYSCGDLFQNMTLLNEVEHALRLLLERTARIDLLFTVGAPWLVRGTLFNCALTCYHGHVVAVAPKAYPPEYREFYELRHFARASEALCTEIEILGNRVPFGTDILITAPHLPGMVLHTEVCEDIWVPIPPSTWAALAGATLTANVSASNITIGKAEYREQLVISASAKNLTVQMYSAAGFGESSTDVAWDGHGIIAERGEILTCTERFARNGSGAFVDVDFQMLMVERMRQSSFHQNAADNPRPFRTVILEEPVHNQVFYSKPKSGYPEFHPHKMMRRIEPHPFVPSDPTLRDKRCAETFNIQATALARRIAQLPQNQHKIILGFSGGSDSTHALLVAAHTFDLLKLPRADILALTMPGFGTSGRTAKNAKDLIAALGVTEIPVPIHDLANLIFRMVGHDGQTEDTCFENVQAWSRKFIELATICKQGGIDLGTGDLSELALGWCTFLGDHASHYGINSGLPKTLIRYVIAWAADHKFAGEPAVQAVLRDILDTPISPELKRPAADGTIAQRSEDQNGPYELHDFFLYYFVRFGFTLPRIARMALHAFEDKYTIGEIKQWLQVFITRFFINQFKRSMMPDGPKVGLACLSPRGDWRMPSDAAMHVWLQELEIIPDNISP